MTNKYDIMDMIKARVLYRRGKSISEIADTTKIDEPMVMRITRI